MYKAMPSNLSTNNSARATVIRNTYSLLALTMLPTILGAFLGMQIPYETYAAHPMMWFFGSLAVSIGMLFLAMKNRDNSLGVILTLAFTGFMGFTLAPNLQFTLQLANGAMLIAQAAGLTAFALFASAAYVMVTKKDFSFLGNMLYVSVIVLILASLISVFFQMPLLNLIISCIGVIIFTGFLLYDVSRVVNGGEDNYVMATLSIYLDILNIFQFMLNILRYFNGR